ncbi:MAG: ATP-binding cassette domain-containing protein, partial [Micropruina sp.]
SRDDRRAVARALERVDLTDRARSPFSELSGGQQQRALIARALTGDSDLMVLDEPLAGVDLGTQDSLANLIAELNLAGLTALVVLHELGPFAGLLNRAIVLREGRIIADGAPPPVHDHGHETTDRLTPPLVAGVMGQED